MLFYVKDKAVHVHNIKAYARVEVQLRSFLISAVDDE